ncbi:hypothetical protein Salat_1434900 [Sesamum alatum]|uniref:Uncharacterized protein n=1 Tax=Sesamum alatum TaxID=300844 RepID=A0AAE2CLL0_9LAMI|nr:hypothetical protein Salat_1434900 [Sesamum alatum]
MCVGHCGSDGIGSFLRHSTLEAGEVMALARRNSQTYSNGGTVAPGCGTGDTGVEFGCIENGQPNAVAVRATVSTVNVVFGTRLCNNFGHSRLNHLKERHDTFTLLITRWGVRWIPRPKLVLVNESLWDVIGREKPFARAYRWDTEPAWEELKIIFDQPKHEPIHQNDDELYPEPQNNLEGIVVRVPFDYNGSS